jgi:hypothetical protein
VQVRFARVRRPNEVVIELMKDMAHWSPPTAKANKVSRLKAAKDRCTYQKPRRKRLGYIKATGTAIATTRRPPRPRPAL